MPDRIGVGFTLPVMSANSGRHRHRDMSRPSARRIIRLSFLFGAIVAVAVLARPASMVVEREWVAWKNRPVPIIASDAETAAILKAVIEANETGYGRPPPPPEPTGADAAHTDPVSRFEKSAPRDLILIDRSVTCPESPSNPFACPYDPKYFFDAKSSASVPLKWRQELQLANRSVRSMPAPALAYVHVTSAAVVDAIFEKGFWKEFYERFPDSSGTLSASIPVLSEDHARALIYVEQGCEGLCGTGYLHVLERTSSGWKQIGRWMLWVS